MLSPQKRLPIRGFTLTEIAIVLGVIGLIVGGVWFVAGMVRENARISQAVNQMNLVGQNMTSMLQGGYNPGLGAGTDITASMISSQAIPSWATSPSAPTTQAVHPWNEGTTATTGYHLFWMNSNPRTYRMSFYQVTRTGCVGLITQATGCTPGQPGCPIDVFVAQSAGTAISLTPPASALTTNQIQGLCAQNNYSGGTNSVEFDFTN